VRWPWAPGKILGLVTLACFLAVAVLARVDAARDPEREWKPSLAELPNPSAVRLPKLVTSAVPVEPVGDSLRIEFGAGLSQPGDAATVTLPEVPHGTECGHGRLLPVDVRRRWAPGHDRAVSKSCADG